MRPRVSYLFPLILSLTSQQALAAGQSLFTDSVSYCTEAKAVLVDQFDIAYWRANQSVTFSFSLASVESNLNTSVNVYLNVYGKQAINTTIDLCSILSGVLCPLPQVNFTGFGTYPVPSSYTADIPSLAWGVPNIEAYARVELISVDTGEVAACIQATLSNGWSSRQTAVSWVSAIFTLVALLVALFHTGATNSPSPAQYRWFDILFLFQAAAATGLMHLNYPLVYSNFVQNFGWAVGMLYSTNMQSSINKMRDKTGGKLSDSAYSSVQYINRKLSPYNVGQPAGAFVSLNDIFESPSSFNDFVSTSQSSPSLISSFDVVARATIPTATDQNATTDLITGIPVYSNTLGIPEANAYDTVFFVFLAFIAIAVAFHVALYAVVWITDRFGRERRGTAWATKLKVLYWNFCIGNALRLCLIGFFPIWIFGFYQFSIGRNDSGLSIFFAVFGLLLTLVPLATVFILSLRRARSPSSTAPTISPLYTSWKWFHTVGVLYRAYRQRYHFTWFAPLVLAMIARAGFIAFGPNHAYAQVIGCIVVEFIVFVYLIACRPHKDRKGDWLSAFLSFCRLCAFGLLIAFITEIGVGAITRTIIGFVLIVLFGIPTILLFLGLIWNLGYGYWWRRHTHRIEDGLEVERFVASDGDDDSQYPAMRQRGIGTFLGSSTAIAGTSNGIIDADVSSESRRGSMIIPSGDGNGSGSPTIGRRTSIMEPVGENVYDSSVSSHHYPSNGHGHTSPISNEDHQAYSEAAYAEAARGGSVQDHYDYSSDLRQSEPSLYSQSMTRATSILSSSTTGRPQSGSSQYYTPAGGLVSSPLQNDERRSSREQQYFGFQPR